MSLFYAGKFKAQLKLDKWSMNNCRRGEAQKYLKAGIEY